MDSFEELNDARKRIKLAEDNYEREYNDVIQALNTRESRLTERLDEVNRRKQTIAEASGNLDAKDDDLVHVNAGGKIVVAKRSTLIQIVGSKLEALFSGRWDKKLQRDSHGRIFLDVDPLCFEAIVDYLNEMMISSKDSPPSPPTVDDEHSYVLDRHLELFGIAVGLPGSRIIKENGMSIKLHDLLKEDDSDGDFALLYQGSRDGFFASAFHSKCDNKGPTFNIIETIGGTIMGGYTSAAWSSKFGYCADSKAFLFEFQGIGIRYPSKLRLSRRREEDPSCYSAHAIRNCASFGPTFGDGSDMKVNGRHVSLKWGKTFDKGAVLNGEYEIKEIEVYQVKHSLLPPPVTRFTDEINNAINTHSACLVRAEADVIYLEENFDDEQTFIETFAMGSAKDVVALNVSGNIMATTRSALCTIEDSVLAQQFDDTKWTEQGNSGTRAKEWSPDEVKTWAKSIDGLPDDVSITLHENKITGLELLALGLDGLKMIGIERAGTVCLLLKEIEKLEKESRIIVTLIEHSSYCFGKILNYLRLKRLHSLGLLTIEPTLPRVQASQKKRFEKVVRYYFPGDVSKFVLGMDCEEVHQDINDRVGNVVLGLDCEEVHQDINDRVGNFIVRDSVLDDVVVQVIRSCNARDGIHVYEIIRQVANQGFVVSEIENVINNLSNEGHIYSTIDEYHYQFAE
jgi:hypothetical protein